MKATPLDDLEKRICSGDARALTELFERSEQATDDVECMACIDAFDRVAELYAMGKGGPEWQEFKAMVKKYNEMIVHHDQAEQYQNIIQQMHFEERVFEKMSFNSSVRERVVEEQDVLPGVMEMFMSDADLEQKQAEYCDAWLSAARTCLIAPRFTELPETVFNELLETVAYLSETEADDDEVTCPHCGSTDVEEMDDGGPSAFSDNCIVCRETEEAAKAGRNLSEDELRVLFRKANGG